MSLQNTLSTGRTGTVDTRGQSGRSRPAGPAWLSILNLLLLLLVVVGGGTLLWARVSAGQRDGAAVRQMISSERAFWQAQAQPPAAESKKKKKGTAARPPKAAVKVEGVAPIASLGGKYTLASLTTDNQGLSDKLGTFLPQDVYIIVDTANNHLYLKRNQEVLLDALCSTGSYSELKSADGRRWFFHTPRGEFKVQRKIKNPIWIKPDWAFIEVDEPVPGARHPDRAEPYVMGDYALSFGNGYYIHGTLYDRLLGQSVTHGCVRLGDKALETVFNTAPIGTPIFIY